MNGSVAPSTPDRVPPGLVRQGISSLGWGGGATQAFLRGTSLSWGAAVAGTGTARPVSLTPCRRTGQGLSRPVPATGATPEADGEATDGVAHL